MNIEPADALLRVLLDCELLDRARAVDGEVIFVSERERGWFRVLEKDRVQYFIRSGGPAFARELALHERAAAALPFLPAVRIAEREAELLVLESFARGLDVVEFHRVNRRLAEWLPAAIGQALAILHSFPFADEAFPRTLPDALLPGDPAQTAPAVAHAVARAAAQWKGHALIHGDAGFDRIIVAPENERRIHLVAWDEARFGDPAWDIGAVVESYYAWSLDPRMIKDLEEPVCPLSPLQMQQALLSFWSSYIAAAGLQPADASARLVRAFGYAGVRMIGRVSRTIQKGDPVTPAVTQMMQAALALMTSPAAAVNAFFVPPPPVSMQQWGAW